MTRYRSWMMVSAVLLVCGVYPSWGQDRPKLGSPPMSKEEAPCPVTGKPCRTCPAGCPAPCCSSAGCSSPINGNEHSLRIELEPTVVMLPLGPVPFPLPMAIPTKTAVSQRPNCPQHMTAERLEGPGSPAEAVGRYFWLETTLVDDKSDLVNVHRLRCVVIEGQPAWFSLEDGIVQLSQNPPQEPLAGADAMMVQVTQLSENKVRLEVSRYACKFVKGTKSNRMSVTRCTEAVKEVKLGKFVKVPLDKNTLKTAHHWVEFTVEDLSGQPPARQVRAGIVPCPLPAYDTPANTYYLPRPIPAQRVECAQPIHLPAPCCPPPMPPTMSPAPCVTSPIAVMQCVAAMPAQPVGPSSVIRAVTEEGQARLEIQDGCRSAMICNKLVLKMASGPVQVAAVGTRVHLTDLHMNALADKVSARGHDQLVLEGRVRFNKHKDGYHTEWISGEKVIIDLTDGVLKFQIIGNSDE